MKLPFDIHVFLEDIIYCPSQIFYYFTDEEDQAWYIYVRQRRGPLTIELIKIKAFDNEGEPIDECSTTLQPSRVYDINGAGSLEEEELEIKELEDEIIWFLRQRFPGVNFPDNPPRKKREY